MKLLQAKSLLSIMLITTILLTSCGLIDGQNSENEIRRRVEATLDAQDDLVEESIEDTGMLTFMTGDPDMAVASAHTNGETLLALTESNRDDEITEVTGAIWMSSEGDSILLYLDESGYPREAHAQGYVILLDNYTADTVDIALIDPSGNIDVSRGVPIDLGLLRTANFTGGYKLAAPYYDDELSGAEAMQMASIALGVFSCAATFASGGTLTLLFAAGCAATIYRIWAATQPETHPVAEGGTIGVGAVSCGTGLANVDPIGIGECGALVTHIGGMILEVGDDSEERQEDAVHLADSSLKYGTGSVQVTLTWDSNADLDLWVTDPDGEKIGFQNARSASNGQLDVDDTDGLGPENIFWPLGGAPSGTYVVEVNHYSGNQTTEYKILVQINGESQNFSGYIEPGEWVTITTFGQ